MEKSCRTCELCIDGRCCGRNDMYGKIIKEPIKNCEEWEISFDILQENTNPIDAIVKKIMGDK